MSLYGHIFLLVKERIKPICDFCFFHPTLLFNLVFDLCPQQSKRARPALFPRIPPFWLKKPGLCPNRILPGARQKSAEHRKVCASFKILQEKQGNKGRALHQWAFRSCSPLLKSQNKSTADHQPRAKRFENEKGPAAKVKIRQDHSAVWARYPPHD